MGTKYNIDSLLAVDGLVQVALPRLLVIDWICSAFLVYICPLLAGAYVERARATRAAFFGFVCFVCVLSILYSVLGVLGVTGAR